VTVKTLGLSLVTTFFKIRKAVLLTLSYSQCVRKVGWFELESYMLQEDGFVGYIPDWLLQPVAITYYLPFVSLSCYCEVLLEWA
jgi:hypothetical protein